MKRLLIFLIILATFAAFSYFSLVQNESYSLEKVNFVINKPYLVAIKELAKKESLEKTIDDNNGKLIYKQWQNFTVEIPKKILRVKEYKLEGKLEFLVEKKDRDLGELRLPFEQSIHIDKNAFNIDTKLSQTQKNILFYNKSVVITPSVSDSLVTEVEIKSELKVKKLIPFFFKDTMNKKVEEVNKKDIEQLKSNLLNITQSSTPLVRFK